MSFVHVLIVEIVVCFAMLLPKGSAYPWKTIILFWRASIAVKISNH